MRGLKPARANSKHNVAVTLVYLRKQSEASIWRNRKSRIPHRWWSFKKSDPLQLPVSKAEELNTGLCACYRLVRNDMTGLNWPIYEINPLGRNSPVSPEGRLQCI